MGIIKEPLHVDFEVENRPLTKEEELKISKFIKSQTSKRELINNDKPSAKVKRQKV
jgi:hypothetical protein